MAHFQTQSAPSNPTNMRGGSQNTFQCKSRLHIRGSPASRGRRGALAQGLRGEATLDRHLDEEGLLPGM